MRNVTLSVVLLLAGATSASAEFWRSREGECGEWRAQWDVTQGADGTWSGQVFHEHVGGPCTPPTGQRARTAVRAFIVGDHLLAVRGAAQGSSVCSYYGQVEGDRVRGFELCEGVAHRLSFAIRFPPGGAGADARRPETPDDGWLDSPRTYERGPSEQGFNVEGPSRR